MPLSYEYDAINDVATIEGVRYAGEFFRGLGGVIPVGATVRVVERRDGVITFQTVTAAHEVQP